MDTFQMDNRNLDIITMQHSLITEQLQVVSSIHRRTVGNSAIPGGIVKIHSDGQRTLEIFDFGIKDPTEFKDKF
jgi:hypothetical protein